MDVLYWRPPSESDLAAMPWHKPEDFPPPPDFDVWEEHWDSIELFLLYQDQWRFAGETPVALDLNVFQHHLRATGIDGGEYERIMGDLAVIASQALVHLRK